MTKLQSLRAVQEEKSAEQLRREIRWLKRHLLIREQALAVRVKTAA